MMHTFRRAGAWLLLPFLLFSLLALAGCGGEKKDRPLQVGMDASYAPFGFQNMDTKEYEGFDVDVIRAIAAEEHFQVQVVNLNFDGLIPVSYTHLTLPTTS